MQESREPEAASTKVTFATRAVASHQATLGVRILHSGGVALSLSSGTDSTHTIGVRIPDRSRSIAAAMLLSLTAAAQESPFPSAGPITPPEDVLHGAVHEAATHEQSRPPDEEAPSNRLTLRSLAEALLRRLAEAEIESLEQLTDNCRQLAGLAGLTDEMSFDAVVERSMRARSFTQKLEAQREETESREFATQLEQFLRKAEFLERLREQQRAARIESLNGDLKDPVRWGLYTRQ